jgi:hypothetical protein
MMKVFQTNKGVGTLCNKLLTFPPPSDKACTQDTELPKIFKFLAGGKQPDRQHTLELDYLHQHSQPFLMHDKQLWHWNAQGHLLGVSHIQG